MEIIVDRALEDDFFFSQIVMRYEKTAREKDKFHYRDVINRCFEAVADRYGYVDCYDASDACSVAYDLMQEAKELLTKKDMGMG